MPRKWNPQWREMSNDKAGADYRRSLRQMIIAAIDWIDEHPDALLQWSEIVLPERTVYVGSSTTIFEPKNEETRLWFAVMTAACLAGREPEAAPTAFMFEIVIACCEFYGKHGWKEFDKAMRTTGLAINGFSPPTMH